MSKIRIKFFTALLILGFATVACSFSPPANCGDSIGGTADTTKFDQYFIRMALVNQNGESGPEGENGMEFTTEDTLDIRADSTSEVAVRACVQSRSGGPIAFDQTQTFTQGSGGFTLGTFKSGQYVIRVIVDDTLVKNFPFFVK